jgi:hypothetical protein
MYKSLQQSHFRVAALGLFFAAAVAAGCASSPETPGDCRSFGTEAEPGECDGGKELVCHTTGDGCEQCQCMNPQRVDDPGVHVR